MYCSYKKNKMLAIIGTAGRSKAEELTKELFVKMVEKTKEIVEQVFKLDPKKITLVSGGAAWCDHIVIDLYLQEYSSKTKLYLPAYWDSNKRRYLEDEKYNSGKVSNYYHNLFSKELGRDTLAEIDTCIKKGIAIDTNSLGFKNRNTKIAQADYLIAFSWGKDKPSTAGTLDTWNKCKSIKKIHVCLYNL